MRASSSTSIPPAPSTCAARRAATRMAEAGVAAPQIASQTLDAVLREILASLNEARIALEAFVEQTDNVQLLQRCRAELSQVQGVLRVLEIHGAALLAE